MIKRRILIAEDSPMMAQFIRLCLESTVSCRIEVVENGAVALRRILHNPYSLVILDNEMPGLRGLDILRKLSRHPSFQAPPIILITSTVTAEIIDAIKSEDLPVRGLLAKPFGKSDFLARIAPLVNQSSPIADTDSNETKDAAPRILFQNHGHTLAVKVVATETFVGVSFNGCATIGDKSVIADALEAVINASPSIVVASLAEISEFDEYFIGHILIFLGTFAENGRIPHIVSGDYGPCAEKLERLGIDRIIRSFPSTAEFYTEVGFHA